MAVSEQDTLEVEECRNKKNSLCREGDGVKANKNQRT